jgi:RNA polymerase sigma factor (sigma-70 family)
MDFEAHRPRLRALAYRMLGSLSEADDAVQEAWLRLQRVDPEEIDNPGGWLTTVTARICLNVLRARETRREEPLAPEPLVAAPGPDPEHEALLADAVGLALLVVLDRLTPAERLAFVLHDMFSVPFSEIGELVDRSPDAARQLASRARRRVRGAAPVPDPDIALQRRAVDAFLAAAREGDFDGLVATLAPDVVLRADTIPGEVVGAADVARRAILFEDPSVETRAVLVNGVPGQVSFRDGRAVAMLAFTVVGGRIAAIDVVADPARLSRL